MDFMLAHCGKWEPQRERERERERSWTALHMVMFQFNCCTFNIILNFPCCVYDYN
jgi:hypothetical protein